MTSKDDKQQKPKSKVQDKNNVKATDELTDESLGKVSGGAPRFGFKPNAPGKNPGSRGGRP